MISCDREEIFDWNEKQEISDKILKNQLENKYI